MACTGCGTAVWGSAPTPLISDDFESYAGDATAFHLVWGGITNPLSTTEAQGGTWSMGNVSGAVYPRAISPPTSVIIFALPIWWGPSSGSFGSEGILNFMQGATHTGFNSHCSLRLAADGTISMRYSSSSTLLESAASGLVPSQWNCITGVLDIADAGAWTVYVNGTQVLNGTGDLSIGGGIGGVQVATETTYYVDNFWLATVPTFASAVHCQQKIASLAFGYKPTVKGSMSTLFSLDGNPNVLTTDNTFEVVADQIILTGTVTGGSGMTALTGDVTGSGSGSVATTIANDAVTYAKMQNVSAASKLLGRGSASGSGNTEEITLGTGLSMASTTLNVTSAGSEWSVLTNGDPVTPELIFDSDGDVIMVETLR